MTRYYVSLIGNWLRQKQVIIAFFTFHGLNLLVCSDSGPIL